MNAVAYRLCQVMDCLGSAFELLLSLRHPSRKVLRSRGRHGWLDSIESVYLRSLMARAPDPQPCQVGSRFRFEGQVYKIRIFSHGWAMVDQMEPDDL